MTPTSTDSALVGRWRAQLTFTKGPREGEREPVTLTFLPDRVVVHARGGSEVYGGDGKLVAINHADGVATRA